MGKATGVQKRPGRPRPFLARYRGPDGREISRSFTTQAEAVAWRSRQLAAMSEGSWVDPRAGRVRLGDWAEGWLSRQSGRLAEATVANRRSQMRTHIVPWFGGWPVARITTSEVERFRQALLDRGLAPRTVKSILMTLRLCLEAARADAILQVNPAQGVTVPRARAVREHRYLTVGEVEALADAFDPAYRLVVWLGALGGLRIGEVLGLSPSRVRDGVITVDRQMRELSGRPVLDDFLKTSSSRRRVVMPERLVSEVDRHLSLYGPSHDGLLFSSVSGGPVARTWLYLRRLRPAVADSIGGALKFHDLRHTHVALLVAQNVHPLVISRRLGHSSIRVTLDTYGHLFSEVEATAAVALDAAFAGSVRAGLRLVGGGVA